MVQKNFLTSNQYVLLAIHLFNLSKKINLPDKLAEYLQSDEYKEMREGIIMGLRMFLNPAKNDSMETALRARKAMWQSNSMIERYAVALFAILTLRELITDHTVSIKAEALFRILTGLDNADFTIAQKLTSDLGLVLQYSRQEFLLPEIEIGPVPA